MINDKAVCDFVKSFLNYTKRRKIVQLDLPKAMEIAKILEIKQPSGNSFEIGNLDDQFLLEADGSPLQTNESR
tara:strand:- start:31 stop:249 length:219 start_codon:yes stop_codon:yes gene_type:complete